LNSSFHLGWGTPRIGVSAGRIVSASSPTVSTDRRGRLASCRNARCTAERRGGGPAFLRLRINHTDGTIRPSSMMGSNQVASRAYVSFITKSRYSNQLLPAGYFFHVLDLVENAGSHFDHFRINLTVAGDRLGDRNRDDRISAQGGHLAAFAAVDHIVGTQSVAGGQHVVERAG